MSTRWFRHYAGMMRDPKFVGVAARSKQPIERVAFVWACMLESAAECQEQGSFVLDNDEVAYFLRCDVSEIVGIRTELEDTGVIDGTNVTRWTERQHESDTSTSRTRRYREKKRHGDVPETLSGGCVTAPETETETETEKKQHTLSANADGALEASSLGLSEQEAPVALSAERDEDVPGELDRRPYPAEYDELWREYQAGVHERNSSKADGYKAWKKLSPADREACWEGVISYGQAITEARKTRADTPAKHLSRFINARAWEPYMEAAE